MFCSVHWELLKQSSPVTNTDRYKHRGFNDKKIPTSSPYFYDKEDSRKHLWMTLFFIEQIHNLCSLPKHYMHMQLYNILKSQIYKLGKKLCMSLHVCVFYWWFIGIYVPNNTVSKWTEEITCVQGSFLSLLTFIKKKTYISSERPNFWSMSES